jgi:hypothetical protein
MVSDVPLLRRCKVDLDQAVRLDLSLRHAQVKNDFVNLQFPGYLNCRGECRGFVDPECLAFLRLLRLMRFRFFSNSPKNRQTRRFHH